MSLCTLIPNKDKIIKYYDEITEESKKYDSGWHSVINIIDKTLNSQWELRLKYYNENMLKKHNFKTTVIGKEYLNCLFQHIYNHTHSSIVDEAFEVLEAQSKYFGKDENGVLVQSDKNILSLWVEELIDCWFFVIENSLWIETHYLLNLTDYNFNSKNISNFLIGNIDNEFNKNLKIMLDQEAAHLTTWFYDNKSNIKDIYTYNIYDLLAANRNNLRQTGWKDWKDFTDDTYNPTVFGNMFRANRDLYIPLLNMLYNQLNNYAIDVLGIEDYDQEHHLSQMFRVIYALYMTKRDENIRRQTEDPRYKADIKDGKVVGVNI